MKISSRILTFRWWAVAAMVLPVTGWANGAVYAMTNAIGNNQVVVWARATNGTLTSLQTIATGGGGSGIQIDPTDSLGSQGGIVLDTPHRHLFAVNTETVASNSQDCQEGSITSFLIAGNGSLTKAVKVSSGGLFPASLTVKGNFLYVLNSGGPGAGCGSGPNITGFQVSPNGQLSPITGSTQSIDPGPLAGTGAGENCSVGGFPTPAVDCGLNPPAFPRSPAEIAFTPAGDQLVVTVKGTNSIYVFPFSNGVPGAPTITQAPGPTIPTYFGFGFDGEGHLIVSEPFGTATSIPGMNKGAVSSFTITPGGNLTPISVDVANGQHLSCWVAIAPLTKRYAYIGNNGSSDISSYTIGDDGSLTLLNATAGTGAAHPNDLAVATDRGSAFLYALNAETGTVGAWKINLDGSLTAIGAGPVAGLPAAAGSQGLVAY